MNVPLFASLFYFSLTVSLSHSPSMINSKAQLWEKSRTHRRTGVFMEPDKIHSRNHKTASTVHTRWLSLNDQCSLGDLWASSIFVVPHITKKNRERNLWNLTSRRTNTIPGKEWHISHSDSIVVRTTLFFWKSDIIFINNRAHVIFFYRRKSCICVDKRKKYWLKRIKCTIS